VVGEVEVGAVLVRPVEMRPKTAWVRAWRSRAETLMSASPVLVVSAERAARALGAVTRARDHPVGASRRRASATVDRRVER
jgi:hypothetical protein